MTEKLTLNKFEEAAELVKKVTLPTKLEYSETLSNMTRRQDLSETETYSIPVLTRFAAPFTRSPH